MNNLFPTNMIRIPMNKWVRWTMKRKRAILATIVVWSLVLLTLASYRLLFPVVPRPYWLDEDTRLHIRQSIAKSIQPIVKCSSDQCLEFKSSHFVQRIVRLKSTMMKSAFPCDSDDSNPFCTFQRSKCSAYPLFYEFDRAGLCSALNNMLNAGMYANALGRTFAPSVETLNYGEYGFYFSQVTDCVEDEETTGRFASLSNKVWSTGDFEIDRTKEHQTFFLNFWRFKNIRQSLFRLNRIELGQKRQAADALLRVNQDLSPLIESLIESSFLSNSLQSRRLLTPRIGVGVHIRRGDKVSETFSLPTLEAYLTEVLTIINRVGAQRNEIVVFISSDNFHDEEEFKKVLDENGISATSLIRPEQFKDSLSFQRRASFGHHETTFNSESMSFKYSESIYFLAELEALARMDYLVCTFSSNVCRFLQVIRRQSPETVTSVDFVKQWDYI
jgi:hypothetical protein